MLNSVRPLIAKQYLWKHYEESSKDWYIVPWASFDNMDIWEHRMF